MNIIEINGRLFKPFITAAEISVAVDRIAVQVNNDYKGSNLLVCPVLTGAYVFAADLLRRLTVNPEVRFVKYASYDGMKSTGDVRCELPFSNRVEGRDVLIVEDVIDTGTSMQYLFEDIQKQNPHSVKICALLFKPNSFKGTYKVDYYGMEVGNEFIVGYGMDFEERGRNLPEIYVIDE